MPRGDRTGPSGMGPLTGRGMGYCAGNDRPGFAEPGYGLRGGGRWFAGGRGFGGRGFGGRGFGWRGAPRGFGGRFFGAGAPVGAYRYTEEDERQDLADQASYLEQELANIRQRLESLEDDTQE